MTRGQAIRNYLREVGKRIHASVFAVPSDKLSLCDRALLGEVQTKIYNSLPGSRRASFLSACQRSNVRYERATQNAARISAAKLEFFREAILEAGNAIGRRAAELEDLIDT